jgi:hypothetical protein
MAIRSQCFSLALRMISSAGALPPTRHLLYGRQSMGLVLTILLDIISPILLMVILGALLRWRFKLDLGTLSKINIYLFVPAFVFHKVSTSTLSWSEMGGVLAVTTIQVAILGALVWGVGRMLGISAKTLSAIAMAVMFYNSGNFGLPLAELAYPKDPPGAPGRDAAAVQAFVLLAQNVLTFTVGLAIAGFAEHGISSKSVWRIVRLPVLPTLAAAMLARWWIGMDASHHLPAMIEKAAGYLANGLVPIALVTLGAQLASRPRWPRWKPVSMVLVLRLLYAPVQMAVMLAGLHWLGISALDLWGSHGWPAELLILTASVPTAVNTLLLTLELDGDADLAADCVFWTTVFSAGTITGWLIVVRLAFGSG